MLREQNDYEPGSWQGPYCRACRQPILPDDKQTHIRFASDRYGFKGLTGDYHAACGKPFASMAAIINMRPMGH